MTDPGKVVERLREMDRSIGWEAAALIEQMQERISKLEARLEIDHAFKLKNSKLERFEIPPNERDDFPDKIECQKATIIELGDQLRRARALIGGKDD